MTLEADDGRMASYAYSTAMPRVHQHFAGHVVYGGRAYFILITTNFLRYLAFRVSMPNKMAVIAMPIKHMDTFTLHNVFALSS